MLSNGEERGAVSKWTVGSGKGDGHWGEEPAWKSKKRSGINAPTR